VKLRGELSDWSIADNEWGLGDAADPRIGSSSREVKLATQVDVGG
jgi:hypothetical protein